MEIILIIPLSLIAIGILLLIRRDYINGLRARQEVILTEEYKRQVRRQMTRKKPDIDNGEMTFIHG